MFLSWLGLMGAPHLPPPSLSCPVHLTQVTDGTGLACDQVCSSYWGGMRAEKNQTLINTSPPAAIPHLLRQVPQLHFFCSVSTCCFLFFPFWLVGRKGVWSHSLMVSCCKRSPQAARWSPGLHTENIGMERCGKLHRTWPWKPWWGGNKRIHRPEEPHDASDWIQERWFYLLGDTHLKFLCWVPGSRINGMGFYLHT